jgi:hypothetical protein
MKNCPNLETLALYAGEELDTSERTAIAAHMADCSACAALVAELQSDRELLQSPPDVPEEAILDLHRRVMSDLPRPASIRRYFWPAAVAACLAILALSSTLSRRQPVAPRMAGPEHRSAAAVVKESIPDLQETSKAQPLITQPSITQARPAHKTRRRAPRSSDAGLIAALDQLFETEPPPAATADGKVVITMLTEDPNVTIILLADSTGESE